MHVTHGDVVRFRCQGRVLHGIVTSVWCGDPPKYQVETGRGKREVLEEEVLHALVDHNGILWPPGDSPGPGDCVLFTLPGETTTRQGRVTKVTDNATLHVKTPAGEHFVVLAEQVSHVVPGVQVSRPEWKQEALRNMAYFWTQRGDLERWSGFEEADLAQNFPEIWWAWQSYKAAVAALDKLFKEEG